jgi:hypothetical protein
MCSGRTLSDFHDGTTAVVVDYIGAGFGVCSHSLTEWVNSVSIECH